MSLEPKSLVIVPTYNEAENIQLAIDLIRKYSPDSDVLVVDDNSPDGTGVLAEEISRLDSHVHVIHRTAKNGLGPAYIHGFEWGLSRGYSVLVEMDADGSHPAEVLPQLIQTVSSKSDFGLAIGSRWTDGGSVVNWPWYRQLISRGGSWYARKLLNLGVMDVTAGFRAFKSSTLDKININQVESQGYCFQIDLTRRAQQAGIQIKEVPIEFRERTLGNSKMNKAIVIEAMFRVTVWGFQRLIHNR